MNYEIRKLDKNDLDQLPALYQEYFNGNTGIQTNLQKMHANFSKLQNSENMFYFGMFDKSEMIGFAHAVLNEDIVDNCDPFVTVWTLRIDPKRRCRGLGTKLMEYIEKFASEKNANFVALLVDVENTRAQKFYENLNYKKEVGFFKSLK